MPLSSPEAGLTVYLVGGALRDQLLGLPVKERDWVVVGATPTELIQRGFKQVGKDFPVFLHPFTSEEYALARTERKTGPGYYGFEIHADPQVTLEEDLIRRDLTVNAMAQSLDGVLVDPFGGKQDLERRLLRHVSPAFVEDPVRILRVARFAARYERLGFQVAEETSTLMQQMVQNGEVNALVPERVWAELVKALGEEKPWRFFEVLRTCGALAKLFPEINALWGVPQPEKYHAEVDTGAHAMLVLRQATRLSPLPLVRFAALTHDLGKADSPPNQWPSHVGHEERGVHRVQELCKRYRVPREYHDLAMLVARWHTHCHRIGGSRPHTQLKVLESLDAFRRPERFEQFLIACESDARGRLGKEEAPYPQAQQMRDLLKAASSVPTEPLVQAGLTGKAFAEALKEKRIEAIRS